MTPTAELWGYPDLPDERDFLDNFTWTPALLIEYAERAQRFLDRLCGDDLSNLERHEGYADCDECERRTYVRFRLGHFTLCRRCVRRRRRATVTA